MRNVTPIRRRGGLATALAIAGLAALFPVRAASAQATPPEVLPLAPGNAWTYDGTIWWVPRNSRRVLEERVRLEMRVLEVVERPGARAALLTGYPRDLVTSRPNRFEGEFTLLQLGSRVHLLRGERGREALRRVQNPADTLADLLTGSDIVLDLPLGEGKTFCSPGAEARGAAGPCWFVSGAAPVERIPVAGLDGTLGRPRFVLELRSGGGHEVRGFVPGIGFTSFAIGHYGDPSALELELIDARLATPLTAPRVVFLKTLDLSDRPAVEMATASDEAERLADAGAAEPRSPRRARPSPVPERTGTPPMRGGASTTAEEPTAVPPLRSEEPPAGPPAPEPRPSPEPRLPDHRSVETHAVAPPVRITVAVEDLPVPVWEEPRPACLDARDWFVTGGAIEIDGRNFVPVGSAEPIDPDNLVPVGEYDGVPTFAGRLSATPHTDLWLPLCGTPGIFRLYADLSDGG